MFRHVARDPVKDTNTVLMASDSPFSADALRAADLPSDLAPLAGEAAARLAPPLEGGAVYTDDHAPVEWLVDASIVQEAAGGADAD